MRLRVLWYNLMATLWFLPGVIVIASVVLAVTLVDVSARVDREVLLRWPRLFGASAESSRGMLAAIAGSMITVAGVTFSITMVAVTQASTQYTPRILRNFMRDRPSQIVLGGLSGVFMYCLVVLRTIRGGDEGMFVPSIAILVGFALAAVGIVLMIYFIHHMASALQASSIVSRVSEDTRNAIDRLFPAGVGKPATNGDSPATPEWIAGRSWTPVPSHRTGYIQAVDAEALLAVARERDTALRMDRGVGDFVVMGAPIVSLVTAAIATDATVPHVQAGNADDVLRDAFVIGPFRTVEQDPAFGLLQLVDIALKALSPGINDPTTAISCIHFIGAVLAHAARRGEEPNWRSDGETVRLVARGPSFADLVDVGFHEVRRHAEGKAAVLDVLITSIHSVADETTDRDRREVLLRHVELVIEAVGRTVPSPVDRNALTGRLSALRARLQDPR